MVSRQVAPFIIALLFVVILPFPAMAQFGYYGPSSGGAYSYNGYGGLTPYPNESTMNRGGYYPMWPYSSTSRPYTVYLDQYHRMEYNRPGKTGSYVFPIYSNAGPNWNRGGYYPPRPPYSSTRPYTVNLDQYHRIEYNQPGRTGSIAYPKYSNLGPNWRNNGRPIPRRP